VLSGQSCRAGNEIGVGSYEPSVASHRGASLAQTVCGRQIAPGSYRHIGNAKDRRAGSGAMEGWGDSTV
jgi:hypothetical protein